MDGCTTARRVRARVSRAALVAVIAVVGLLALPGTASAGGEVTPILDCIRQNGNGTYTVVLGYTNTSSAPVTIPHGTWNELSPGKYDGRQPTTFQPGTRHGAFTINIKKSEYMGGPSWFLGGRFVFFGWAWTKDGATSCPSSTELPEEGNGTGPAIALLGAGLVGGVMVHRARKRALAADGHGDA